MKDLLPAAMMYIYLHGSVRPVETVPPDGIPPIKEKDGINGLFLDNSAVLETLDRKEAVTMAGVRTAGKGIRPDR